VHESQFHRVINVAMDSQLASPMEQKLRVESMYTIFSTPIFHAHYFLFSNGWLQMLESPCACSGQRILGLGDLGANGIGISIGKAQLYSLAAGVYPEAVVPVALDVGCDSEDFRMSPAYIGLQQPRLQGEPYEGFVQEFHSACQASCFIFCKSHKQLLMHRTMPDTFHLHQLACGP
jgi:hypothetical protein